MSDLIPAAQDIGNVVIFLAPGYIARQIYRSKFSIKDFGDLQLLITSIVYSLPLVIATNILKAFFKWFLSLSHTTYTWFVPSPDIFDLTLLIVACAAGFIAIWFREERHIRERARKLGFSDPETDLYKIVFDSYHPGEQVTVTLKNGRIFGGLVRKAKTDDAFEMKQIYFRNVQWVDPQTNTFSAAPPGELLVSIDEILYIQV